MSDVFWEKDHKPKGSFPYIALENENLSFLAHFHEEIEVIYIESGSTTTFSHAKKINLNSGDICIFMPGEIHSFTATAQNNMYVYKITASSYAENTDFDKIRLKNNVISQISEIYSTFFEIIDEIRYEFTHKKTGYEFAIRSLKNRLIANILRNTDYDLIHKNKNLNMLTVINEYIEKNYTKEITLEEIARVCHLSKYYFSHLFKELTGMSFFTYLSHFRLEKSTALLTDTKNNITDIALACGFGNVRSFNRMFKDYFKITPLKFRQNK